MVSLVNLHEKILYIGGMQDVSDLNTNVNTNTNNNEVADEPPAPKNDYKAIEDKYSELYKQKYNVDYIFQYAKTRSLLKKLLTHFQEADIIKAIDAWFNDDFGYKTGYEFGAFTSQIQKLINHGASNNNTSPTSYQPNAEADMILGRYQG